MDVVLLARAPSGSHLTDSGRLVLGWAEEVLDAADRLEAGLRSIRSGVSHRLAIAASQTNAEHLVPHWLIELRMSEEAKGYPPTVVELAVANSTGVIKLVRGSEAEVGFIETPHLPADLATCYLRDDELLVVSRHRTRGHAATGRSRSRRSRARRWPCARQAAAPATP